MATGQILTRLLQRSACAHGDGELLCLQEAEPAVIFRELRRLLLLMLLLPQGLRYETKLLGVSSMLTMRMQGAMVSLL